MFIDYSGLSVSESGGGIFYFGLLVCCPLMPTMLDKKLYLSVCEDALAPAYKNSSMNSERLLQRSIGLILR